MSEYTPDNWVVIKFNGDDPHYRILAGWSGGYLHGDSWRMNSGITRVDSDDDYYYFFGSSQSCYVCSKRSYCLQANNASVWHKLEELHGDKVELMPEETNWLEIDWIIN